MKRLKLQVIICIALLYIIIGNMCMSVHAAELELEPCESTVSDPYKFKISYTWTSEGKAIESYDISESGQIVITFPNRTIGVFDHDMNFQYQLSFENSGAAGALWPDDNLLFISLRSNTAVVCDKAGNAEHFYTITGPDNYFFKVVESRARNQRSDSYFCTNGSGGNNPLVHYSQYTILKRISEDGEEKILYEASALHTILEIGEAVANGLFFLLIPQFELDLFKQNAIGNCQAYV